jgi:hypothetical protein
MYKRAILLFRDGGYGVVVVQTVSGDHYVVAIANATQEGNLVGDIRRWSRGHGYQFLVKRADERISAPKESVLMLPNGRVIEIRNVYTTAGVFTRWGLSRREPLPAGYVRL